MDTDTVPKEAHANMFWLSLMHWVLNLSKKKKNKKHYYRELRFSEILVGNFAYFNNTNLSLGLKCPKCISLASYHSPLIGK